jgi:urease accessory protein
MSHDHHHHDHDHNHAHGDCGHDHAHGESDIVYTRIVANHIKIASVLLKDAPTLELTYAQRQAPPHEVKLSNGTQAFLHLDESLQAGDRLVAEVNRWATVTPAVEELLKLSGSTDMQMKACIRLGQLGQPMMVAHEHLYVLDCDATRRVAAQVELRIDVVHEAFTPVEADRRRVHTCNDPSHNHGHAHDHTHDHDHDHHSHGHAHSHSHDQ